MKNWNELSRRERALLVLFGLFGGAAPPIIGMLKQLSAGLPDGGLYMAYDPVAWAGCLFSGLMGVVVVLAYKEVRREKALALGAAAPALLLGFAAGSTDSDPGIPISAVFAPPPVYAQELPDDGAEPPLIDTALDSLWISIPQFEDQDLLGRSQAGFALVFTVPDSAAQRSEGAEYKQSFSAGADGPIPLAVPEGARDLYLMIGDEVSNRIDLNELGLSREDSLSISVERRKRSLKSRFLRPFGVRSKDTEALAIKQIDKSKGP